MATLQLNLRRILNAALIAVLILSLSACSVNPVTGEQELAWVSESWELQTGEQYYGFQQQAGGGYYTLDRDLTGYVRSVGNKLAKFSARPHLPYEFVVLNDSTPNAWALPGGKIAVNRGLLMELKDEAELAAVLAHEIVHADARHSAQSQEVGSLISLGQVAAASVLQNSDYNNAVLQQGIGLTGLYGQTRYSRSRELEADEYGMIYMQKAGYDPTAAISLQQTFVRLSQGRNADLFSTLFASHPPSMARVNANATHASRLPYGGQRNKNRFEQETAQLRKRQPAYKLATDAQKAIANKEYQQAIGLTNKAIAIEPKEGGFYEIKGVALEKLNRGQDALKALDQAVRLNPQYFRPVLRRGLLKHKMKSFNDAESDLKTSLKMAPTQIAHAKLGEIAENRKNCVEARQHYENALKAGGEQSQALQNKLNALQVSCN
jgi:predicted Zn-dependent protease